MTARAPISMAGIPGRDNAGLQDPFVWEGSATTDMLIPPAVLDPDGTMAPGALAVLADSAIGFAIVHAVGDGRGMATSHLHLELVRSVPPATTRLRCIGNLVHAAGSYGLGSGTITDAEGSEIARATVGAVLLELRTIRPPDSIVATGVSMQHRLDGGVDGLLGASPAEPTDHGCHVHFVASAAVANTSGGVHGGMGVLMAERAMHAAAFRDASRPGLRLVELRASFPRPIAADGSEITCIATRVHAGRRLVLVRAELLDQRGRPAVVADGTYVAADG